MLPLLVRVPTMRLSSAAPLQILKRTQSIAVHQRASNRQQQALIRGGLALVAIGGTGYVLNKVSDNETSAFELTKAIHLQLFRFWTVPRWWHRELWRDRNKSLSLMPWKPIALSPPQSKSIYVPLMVILPVVWRWLALSRTCFIVLDGRHGSWWVSSTITMLLNWWKMISLVNKWAYLGVSLVGTIGALYATRAIDDRKNPALKYATWALFNGAMGLSLAPLCFMQPALIARAALMTSGVVGSISAVGMTARREQYLWIGGPLSKEWQLNVSHLHDDYFSGWTCCCLPRFHRFSTTAGHCCSRCICHAQCLVVRWTCCLFRIGLVGYEENHRPCRECARCTTTVADQRIPWYLSWFHQHPDSNSLHYGQSTKEIDNTRDHLIKKACTVLESILVKMKYTLAWIWSDDIELEGE